MSILEPIEFHEPHRYLSIGGTPGNLPVLTLINKDGRRLEVAIEENSLAQIASAIQQHIVMKNRQVS